MKYAFYVDGYFIKHEEFPRLSFGQFDRVKKKFSDEYMVSLAGVKLVEVPR